MYVYTVLIDNTYTIYMYEHMLNMHTYIQQLGEYCRNQKYEE